MEKFCLDSAGAEYRAARAALLEKEIALKDRCEEVAALRRALPRGAEAPQDYALREAASDGSVRGVRLSELFEPGRENLIVVHFMWAEGDESPCPMCTLWTEGYNAVAPYLMHAAPLALVAAKAAPALGAFARRRRWKSLRILSSGGTSFNADFGMETPDGAQSPGVSVFIRNAPDRPPLHFYTTSAILGGGHYRGLDLLSPLWNLLDLLPRGRGDYLPNPIPAPDPNLARFTRLG